MGNICDTRKIILLYANSVLVYIYKRNLTILIPLLGESLSFSTLLKAYRIREGITQLELAKELNVGVTYISDLENKRRKVSIEQAIRFAKILDQSEIYFAKVALQDMVESAGLEVRVELLA